MLEIARTSTGREYIKGFEETRKALLDLEIGERNDMNRALKEAAQLVASRVRAPYKSGRLQRSVRGAAARKVRDRFIRKGVVSTGINKDRSLDYARRVSLGTYQESIQTDRFLFGLLSTSYTVGRRYKGNTFLKDARDRNRGAVVRLINKRVLQMIRRKGFKTTNGTV
jgi:hypothetical protein